MNKNGHVIIIVDNKKDEELFTTVFDSLNYSNKVIFFSDGESALNFLNNSLNQAFVILSDIKMPKLTGMELMEKLEIDAALNIKCIPYLFFSTAVEQREVIDAYSTSVQGFFLKQNTVEELRTIIKSIMEYWKRCYYPPMMMPRHLEEINEN